jgi:hypothetical protein
MCGFNICTSPHFAGHRKANEWLLKGRQLIPSIPHSFFRFQSVSTQSRLITLLPSPSRSGNCAVRNHIKIRSHRSSTEKSQMGLLNLCASIHCAGRACMEGKIGWMDWIRSGSGPCKKLRKLRRPLRIVNTSSSKSISSLVNRWASSSLSAAPVRGWFASSSTSWSFRLLCNETRMLSCGKLHVHKKCSY